MHHHHHTRRSSTTDHSPARPLDDGDASALTASSSLISARGSSSARSADRSERSLDCQSVNSCSSSSSSVTSSPAYRLPPDYRISFQTKVNELFLRWITQHDTQKLLRDALQRFEEGSATGLPNVSYDEDMRNAAQQFLQQHHLTEEYLNPPHANRRLSMTPPPPPPPPICCHQQQQQTTNTGDSSRKSGGDDDDDAGSINNNDDDNNTFELPNNSQQTPVTPALTPSVPNFLLNFARSGSSSWTNNLPAIYGQLPGGYARLSDFGEISKALGLPLYWKRLLFQAAGGHKRHNRVSYEQMARVWSRIYASYYDRAAQFMALMTWGKSDERSRIEPNDWEAFMLDVVNTHPGLEFLKRAKEFIARYCTTVIARIYFSVNRSWSGKITVGELRNSNILDVIEMLERQPDINQINDYFSYEHFYVIYCKFWDIDHDHDMMVSKQELYEHNNRAISKRIIDRIFSGAVYNSENIRQGQLSLSEFVWFLIAEEDKQQNTSIEYWFRCMDVDGDGILSMFELEMFYQEQIQQLEKLNYEFMQFEDLICQMLDMIKPRETNKIRLVDLKRSKMAHIFFDTFINIQKYLDHDQRDSFAEAMAFDGEQISDWDRYATEEYENLIREDQVQSSTTTNDDEISADKQHQMNGDDDEPQKIATTTTTTTQSTGNAIITFSNL